MSNYEGKIISCKDICFAYDGMPVLSHISFDVMDGECLAFMGPNGCGKSTLFKIINGLAFPELGTYQFKGKSIDRKTLDDATFAKVFHQQVGFIFQNSDLQLFCSNVREELEFGPVQMGLAKEDIERRVGDVAAMLSLESLLDRAPYHLSGGEKKRVAIGCILTMNPQVLILDEPLAGLDEQSQKWLLGFLQSLKKSGKTIIFATHDRDLANSLADRILTIDSNHRLLGEMH